MFLVEMVGPVLVDGHQAVEILFVVPLVVDDQLFLGADAFGRVDFGVAGALFDSSAGVGFSSGLSSLSSRTGFSWSSCSIRSCRAMTGSCRISID